MKCFKSFIMLLLLCFGPTIVGCGKAADHDAGTVGQAIGENVTDFARGVGKGIDNKLHISTEISPALVERGVTLIVGKQGPLHSTTDDTKAISLYFLTEKAIAGTMIAKAYNSDDQEIGRAKTVVEFSDDDAQYVKFPFPPEMDRQLVAKYKFDIIASSSDPQPAEAARSTTDK